MKLYFGDRVRVVKPLEYSKEYLNKEGIIMQVDEGDLLLISFEDMPSNWFGKEELEINVTELWP